MADARDLRPIERRVLTLQAAGYTTPEIARRFRRGPRFIEQVADLARLDDRHAGDGRGPLLRPIERRVLELRDRGMSLEELSRRFRRSTGHIALIERLARYKLRRADRRR
jgi:transcriptional regulator